LSREVAVQVFQVLSDVDQRHKVEFSRDGRYIGVASRMRYTLFDTTGLEPPETLNPVAFGLNTWFTRCGRIAISQSLVDRFTLAIYDRDTQIQHRLDGGYLSDAVVNARGDTIILSVWVPDPDFEYEVWVVAPSGGFTRHKHPAQVLAIAANGQRLAGRTRTRGHRVSGDSLRLWDMAEGVPQRRARIRVRLRYLANDFALTHDGRLLAVADGRTLSLWDASRGRRLAHSGQHKRSVTAVACSPTHPLLVTGDKGGKVFLWDTNAKVLQRYDWGLKEVSTVTFAADGLRAAAVDATGKVVLWDVDA
jgi:WD40 repeat protein